MLEKDALTFADKIVKICEQSGVWHEVTKSARPKLGKIDILISLKIEPDGRKCKVKNRQPQEP